MAELGLAVVQTLFTALQCSELREICSKLNYESQLEELNKTVTAIKNVLLDADSMLELSNEARSYIEELKDAVYDADDLFDEFLTRIELEQIRVTGSKKHHEIIDKVRCFFSPKNQVSQAYKMCRKVDKIRKKLDAIVDNRKFALKVNSESIFKRREESCAYVDVKDIIGRYHEKKDILDMVLDSNDNDVRFLTIVGVGGLGKTALAQIVFNDEKIIKEFANLSFWVCVSDQEKQQFDVKAILCKFLESVTGKRFIDLYGYTLQSVKEQLRENLGGKKYLLVLDDVWNESREKWVGVQNSLMLGHLGSRIMVTTRSEMTARIIGDGNTYKLGGLSREDSWNLFEMTAFNKGDHQQVDQFEFVEIGSKIVEKCYNIPLAIKVVGSLLYGLEIIEWRAFEKSGLADIGKGDNEIMFVLKLSYHNLEPSLKSCFTYCALFPKDFRINRTMLISLWIAQGYIVPLNGGQSIEDAAEEHFLILLRRCFFQDVKKDIYDDVESVQIHDLMHDVAQEVGAEEIQVLNSVADHNFGDKIRHVHYVGGNCSERSFRKTKIRSYIDQSCYETTPLGIPVENWMCLRVLDLRYLGVDSSLDSIGKLLHLRYLNLSYSFFEALPDSVTKIHNLQTLDLSYCISLKELPHNFSKLHNLQTLDLMNTNLRELPHHFSKLHNLQTLNLQSCKNLIKWPHNFDKLVKLKHLDISFSGLTSLRVLTDFVVGNRTLTETQYDDELKDLKSLNNLTGGIIIHVFENYRITEGLNDMRGGYLSNMKHLKKVSFHITQKNNPEAVLVKLEPHPNLKELSLMFYSGTTIPMWGKSDWTVSLPHLVKIEIVSCKKLQHMPSLSKLPNLKYLKLWELKMLEYVENPSNAGNYAEGNTTTIFFPSLESLDMVD